MRYESKLHRGPLFSTSVLLFMVVATMAFGFAKIQIDDAYIFYSYADHITHGSGYVFNAGERVNATTSSLYTLILALVSAPLRDVSWFILPVVGHLIGALGLFITAITLVRCFRTDEESLFPYVLPLVFLANPLLSHAVGMEIFLTMMFGVSGLYFWMRKKVPAASICCSLAVLARPDMLLLVVIMGAYDLFIHRRCPSLIQITLFSLPIIAWLAFSRLYFGEFIPSTLAAKTGQAESGRWGEGLLYLKGLISSPIWHGRMILYMTALVVVAGLGVMIRNLKRWSLFSNPVLHVILLWNLTHVAVYGIVINPPAYEWHYTVLALGISILAALPIEAVHRYFRKKGPGFERLMAGAMILILVASSLALPLKKGLGPVSAKYEVYKHSAAWLNEHVEEGSSIGATEIGVLRYFYDKGPVIDGLGLATPEVIEHLAAADFGWYVHHFQPDYLMYNHPHRPVLEAIVDTDWFRQNYTLLTTVDTSRLSVAIYRRKM